MLHKRPLMDEGGTCIYMYISLLGGLNSLYSSHMPNVNSNMYTMYTYTQFEEVQDLPNVKVVAEQHVTRYLVVQNI